MKTVLATGDPSKTEQQRGVDLFSEASKAMNRLTDLLDRAVGGYLLQVGATQTDQ